MSKFWDDKANVYSDTEYTSARSGSPRSDKESGSSDYEEDSDPSEQFKRKFQGSSPDNFELSVSRKKKKKLKRKSL